MAEAEANPLQQCPRCREDAQRFVVFHLKALGKFQGHLWQKEEGSGSGRKMLLSSQAAAAGTMAPTTGSSGI